jgi:hypothetical protein
LLRAETRPADAQKLLTQCDIRRVELVDDPTLPVVEPGPEPELASGELVSLFEPIIEKDQGDFFASGR